MIYYKSKKVSNIIMQNNMSNTRLSDSDRSYLIYEFTCPERDCSSSKTSYIGLTNRTLRERLAGHKYRGSSIYNHYINVHKRPPDFETLVNSTKILYFCDNRRNLPVFEALFIKKYKPILNENIRDFTCLKLNIS